MVKTLEYLCLLKDQISDSMLNMNSPLNQGGYVGGGMSASDYRTNCRLIHEHV